MEAQTRTLSADVVKPVSLHYRLWLPAPATPQPVPLILFLHGSGERGDDLALVDSFGLPQRLCDGFELPAIVAAPQCPAASDWELHTDSLLALLDDLLARYPVDPLRVYITGLSMGGRGTWLLAAYHAERFAAAVPICGRRPGSVRVDEHTPQFVRLPVWAFHGARDQTVPVTETEGIVAGLRAAGSDVRCTIYPEADHDSWTQAYAEPELYDWLFAQRRTASPGAPVAA